MKLVTEMNIEELREDLNNCCYDLDKVKSEGTTGRNVWSIVWIEKRINDIKTEINKHEKRLQELMNSDSTVKSYWNVYKFINSEKVLLGTIDLPSDCFGDELYEIMEKNEWIETIDNYNVDGDSEFVAVMGKTEQDGDFSLEFIKE